MANHITRKTEVNTSESKKLRCARGQLAILSGTFGTRMVRIKSRAADICLDWKVEVLGSPVWAIDARTNKPAFTNLGLVKDLNLFPVMQEAEEVCYA